jgi:hypothetical protein
MFSGVEAVPEATKAAIYINIYQMALLIPVISVLGVCCTAVLKRVRASRLRRQGVGRADIVRLLDLQVVYSHRAGNSARGIVKLT